MTRPERQEWWDWYAAEILYADAKFGKNGVGPDQSNGHDEAMRTQGLGANSFWLRQILQYADRCRLFGMDTPQGRQALCKLVMTAIGAVESAIRVHGHLPQPGLSSGDIKDWNYLDRVTTDEDAANAALAAKLHSTTDAMVWAEEFAQLFGVVENTQRGHHVTDVVGLMVGWFANAMVTAEMHNQNCRA